MTVIDGFGCTVRPVSTLDEDAPTVGPERLDMVEMARAMRSAVIDDDTDEVHRLLEEIRHGLIDHMAAFIDEPIDHEDVISVVVRQGHRRLLRLVETVAATVGEDPRQCSCIVRSVEIEEGLRRQAALEARLK